MQKVAVIGAGGMGGRHAAAYADIPNAELVAICDAQSDRAEELAKKHSVKAYSDLEKLLADIDVDIIDICTPTTTHLENIRIAAAAGKHISSEKPLERTVSSAAEAVRVCREAGVTLFVAHVLRWFPEYRTLHDLIKNGAVGETVEVRTSRGGRAPHGFGDWFGNLKMSGGVILDLIIHEFDWLRWCYGDVKRVYARGLADAGIPFTDYALITLRFENGVIAHVEGQWTRPSGFVTSVEVAGTEGLLNFANSESVPLVIERREKEGSQPSVIVPESPVSINPYRLELQHFIDCLEEGKEPDVKPEDALEAVKIAEAALKSVKTGQPVTLTREGSR